MLSPAHGLSVEAASDRPEQHSVSACPGARRTGLVNALLRRAWRSGLAAHPSLDPEALVHKARRQTGCGIRSLSSEWRQRLERLVGDLETAAALTPLGRTIAHGQLVAATANRMRVHRLWLRQPEILEQPLGRPIVIVGQMRSGSTRAQRLLACDPRLRFTRFFESWNPVPRRPRVLGADDRRIRAAAAFRVARWLNPAFDAIHPTGVDHADEEVGLLNLSLSAAAFEVQWRVPAFARMCEDADLAETYSEFRRMVQTIAWLRGVAGDTRPWVLKVPQFSQDLAAVLSTFPDARVIRLRRPLDTVVASSASLVRNQMRIQSNDVDARWIGGEWLRKTALRERRTNDALARSDVARVELEYAAVDQDWEHEMTRVYAMLGLPLTPDVRRRMAAFLSRSRRRHRPHDYEAAQFGLSAATIRAAFAEEAEMTSG